MASHSHRAEICATILLGALATTPGAWAQAQSNSNTNNVPPGMVAYYTAPGNPATLDCPSGWGQYSNGQGRLILGTIDGTEANTTNDGYQVTADGQAPVHDHPFTATWTLQKQTSVGGSGSYSGFASSGNKSGAGTAGAGGIGYGYIQYLVCESQATGSTGDEVPANTIGYFTSSTCPANWEPQPTLAGYFPMPAAPNGPVGQLFNGPGWNISSFPTHTHSNATVATFWVQTLGVQYNGVASGAKATHDSVPISAQLQANGEAVLPAVALLVCQKQAVGSGNGIPAGLSLFYSVAYACPETGWGPAVGSPGFLVLGIPGSNGSGSGEFTQGLAIGTPITQGGALPSHTHPISITADLGNNTTAEQSGSDYYGKGGNYTAYGTTSAATVAVPYVALLMCQVQ